MSVNYIERLRETYTQDLAYARGRRGFTEAFHQFMDDVRKIEQLFRGLDNERIDWTAHRGSGETTITATSSDKRLHLKVFCSTMENPEFSLHARIYPEEPGIYPSVPMKDHILETTDPDAMISFIYFIINSVDPDRGKWIKI